jgi:hypothetical protein
MCIEDSESFALSIPNYPEVCTVFIAATLGASRFWNQRQGPEALHTGACLQKQLRQKDFDYE